MYTEAQLRGHVYDLQRFLRRIQRAADHPAPLAPDGIYGPETVRAVRDFQRQNGLPATGKADFAAWSLLYAQYASLVSADGLPAPVWAFPPQADAVLGAVSKGDAVTVLQIMLNTMAAHFPDLPRAAVSGVYDEATAQAVSAAQARFLLPQTGRTDRATWNALAAFHNAHVYAVPLPWLLAECK